MNFSVTKFSIASRAATLVILASFIFSGAVAVGASTNDLSASKTSAMTAFTTDLTQLGREGRLREDLSFESETIRLIEALGDGDFRQPVIIDEDKANQQAIVEQFTLRIAKGAVPSSLAGKTILQLETASLFSNARTSAAAAAAIGSILDEVIASDGRIILYADELTNVVGSMKELDSLIKGLTYGKLNIIGACGMAAYNENIENSLELTGFFEGILLNDRPTTATDKKQSLEVQNEYRGDNISPDLREMMAQDPNGSKRVDVIIQAKNADNAALRSLMATGEARVSSRIGKSQTLVVNLPLSALNLLSTSGLINYISPDRPTAGHGFVEDTTGTSAMRSQPSLSGRPAYTLDGTGIGVAVLDSGIYPAHNGFKNSSGNSRIVANVNFTTDSATTDSFGHGTHVAGLAVGNNSYSSGAYRGVATNANIVSVKVLNNNGTGQTSWLLNGLNWVLQNRTTHNIRVVNLSLGTDAIDYLHQRSALR